MALRPPKPPRLKAPNFQLGKKPIMRPVLKKPNMVMPRSVKPYAGPAAGKDYGQNFLYPGGYNQPKNPVDMSNFFTGGGGSQYAANATVNNPQISQPDYGSLIAGDWEVQNAESDMGAQMARARGNFQAGLRQQLIDLGISDTSKLGSLGKYIDEDTIKAAVANKYSATAQIAQQEERGRAGNNAALAARGLLSSGQTTKSQTDLSAAAESGRYSALRSFLSGGAEGLTGLGDLESQLANAVAQARGNAAMRASDQYQLGAGGGELPGGSSETTQTSSAGRAAQAARARMMTRRQFLARPVLPQGRGRSANVRYQNYVNAFRRNARR